MPLFALFGVSACSPNDLVGAKPPYEVLERDRVESEAGAVAMYDGAISYFTQAFHAGNRYLPVDNYVVASGIFADEFQPYGTFSGLDLDARRYVPASPYAVQPGKTVYENLQSARVAAMLARQALVRYGREPLTPLRAHVMVLEAYTVLHLAELFCSGVPLTEVPLDDDPVFSAGLTTAQLNERALVLFDSALALAGDSLRFALAARVGKARALLNLGRFDDIATTLAAVPTTFQFATEHSATIPSMMNVLGSVPGAVSVSSGEGGNGQPFSGIGDPRVPLAAGFVPTQALYTSAASATVLASGIEARLAEAEAQLRAGDASWLTTLNALRTSCTDAMTCPAPAPAGSGGTAGLPPLADPGSAAGRLNLVYSERAFWLFATGHRQGDLRRLLRVYGRDQATVYPTGLYTSYSPILVDANYGDQVVLQLPTSETQRHPTVKACLNLGA